MTDKSLQLKCKIGLHCWGKWQYVTRFEDETPESCRLKRACTECQKDELRDGDRHSWSEWQHISERQCKRKRNCRRCGAEETGSLSHRWSEWGKEEKPCEEKRHCRTCDAYESRWQHEWRESSEGGRRCSRCDAEDETGKFQLCRESGACEVCNGNIEPGEGYCVPVALFYASPRLKDWVAKSLAIDLVGGIDSFLMQEMCCDGRKDCLVCKQCIKMFL